MFGTSKVKQHLKRLRAVTTFTFGIYQAGLILWMIAIQNLHEVGP